MSINITVNGRLTKDPELRHTQTGKLVTNFGLAHNFRERVSGQMRDVTTVVFDASVWEEGGAVEVAETLATKRLPDPVELPGVRMCRRQLRRTPRVDHHGSRPFSNDERPVGGNLPGAAPALCLGMHCRSAIDGGRC